MSPSTREVLQGLLDGAVMALECEEAVVSHLQQYRDEWDRQRGGHEPIPSNLTRKVRQALSSRNDVSRFKREIATLTEILNQVEA